MIYIYIYIYSSVCVCVCVCVRAMSKLPIMMKTKYLVRIILFGMFTTDGDVIPLFIFSTRRPISGARGR